MKKLLVLLFTLVVAFAMTMPVFAQEAGAGQETTTTKTKKTKKTKAAKTKKTKSSTTTPPAQ